MADDNTSQLGNEELIDNEASINEESIIEEIVDVTLRAAKFIGSGGPRRLPHHKSHGCLQATFKVAAKEDLPEDFRVGVFAEPGKEYAARVRFSNADPKSFQPDSMPDIRGLGIKLFLRSPFDPPEEVDQSYPLHPKKSIEQDFLLATNPAFFSHGPKDFLGFAKALTVVDGVRKHFDEYPDLGKIYVESQIQIDTPLDCNYYSQVPFRLGRNGPAVKYRVRPLDKITVPPEKWHPSYLKLVMKKHFEKNGARLEFAIQVQRKDPNNKMPIEDPAVVWSEDEASGGSRFVPVATLTLHPQELQDCDELSFRPWNGLEEHSPLGAINRIRNAIYKGAVLIRSKPKTHLPFNGVMIIKNPPENFFKVRQILLENGLVNAFALHRLGFAHFVRFLLFADPPPPKAPLPPTEPPWIPKSAQMLIITTFDFDMRDYLLGIVDEIGDILDQLLPLMEGAPPTPVREHRQEFIKYIEDINKPTPLFFSAYPDLSVQNVLKMEGRKHE